MENSPHSPPFDPIYPLRNSFKVSTVHVSSAYMGNGIQCKQISCIRNGKVCNKTLMDICVMRKYIYSKRREMFGNGNTRQLITREKYIESFW